MSLSSFLANLVIPLNLCVTLLLIAVVLLMLRWRRTAFTLITLSVAWGLFWSLPASSLWAGGRLEQLYPHAPAEALPAAQAIVVLGGHTAGGRQNWFQPYHRDTAFTRTAAAALLYQAERAPLILLSGAALEGTQSEAEYMAANLRKSGVPPEALIVEKNSYNTYENALYSARILKERDISRVLLVTSALHMPRAMAVFNKQGLTAIAAPPAPQIVVPDDPDFSFWLPDGRSFFASRSIIKEYVGMLIYWLRGWI
ncbi:YdcF family protein [Pusillimonas sp.]|uniref:YdcF family protein n=1 Tax=Pusillimonas sp. TaxID=3040095 RepID=UPI0037CC350A